MPINTYIGLMGSGKSFEVVSSVILPALLKGRRVVTNIDGINSELISEYLIKNKGGKLEQLGELVAVKNDDVIKTGFFPDETKPDQSSIVRGGDLVCLDECWNFWGDDHKISDEHMRFFRMHRHYTDPVTGIACDLALMIQDLGTLNRKIRAVVEMTFRTVKLKSIGIPVAYRVEVYEGNKTIKATKVDVFVKKYDKAIFPLYKSYAAGSGKEKPIDSRQNVLTNPRLWISTAILIGVTYAGYHYVNKFFNPSDSKSKSIAPVSNVQPGADLPKQDAKSDFSADWRYAGTYVANGERWAVLVDSVGRLRFESPSVFTGKGFSVFGVVDGKKVTSYSGGNGSTLLGGSPSSNIQQNKTK